MSKDIQVYTAIDAKVKPAERLDILVLSTEGKAEMKTYNDLELIKQAFAGKKIAKQIDRLFNQDHTLADTLIRRVRTAGIDNPQNEGGEPSTLTAVFIGAATTTPLEPKTTYYAKLGGKPVVPVKTGTTPPADDRGFANLFKGVTFTEDYVDFTAKIDTNGVVFTSTTRTTVSGYDETVGLYADEECMVSLGLTGAQLVVHNGREDVTRAQNLVAAIEALRDIDDDFYIVLTDVIDEDCVDALCAWAESTEPTEAALGAGVEDHRKFYFGQTDNKNYKNTHGRSAVIYTEKPLEEWADAAWLGCVGPFWPQSVTWKWKVPDGLTPPDLRDSERETLEENFVNFFTVEYKHEYVKNGICGDGNFIDNVLGADYITQQMRENLYAIFLANPKIGYTDAGFAIVASGVYAALNRATALSIIAKDPESNSGIYTVTIPKRADATDEQARNRIMPNIEWEAQLEGAIHSVKVRGVLRVTLNR